MDDARMRHAPAPQPSSFVTTLRALVMLVCLIGLPALALRVTELPFPLREYVIEWLGGTVAKTETRADLDEAPPFVPPAEGSREPIIQFPQEAGVASIPGVPQSGFGQAGPSANPPWNASGPPSQNQFSAPTVPQGIPGVPPSIQGGAIGQPAQSPDAVLANYDSPAYPPSNPPAQIPQQPGGTGLGGGTAGYGEPPLGTPNPALSAPTNQTIGRPDTLDQFRFIEKRLRDLGADYYLLENWGNQGECYRFHCRIAVANNSNFTKHFEATDSQPLAAMTRVLADVEAWQRESTPWEPSPPTQAVPSRYPSTGGAATASPHGPYSR
ncbi:MAG: hypothetical protein GXX96_23285 [Planctomycetaceae bacterium]|nr:hypothetical protein [Planctomycetaceae bacterium]